MIDELVSLHETHDYTVIIKRVEDRNGITVSFPGNVLVDPVMEPEVWGYIVTDVGVAKVTQTSDNPIGLPVPDYARRIIILADIMLRCAKYPMSPSLIIAYDKDGKKIVDNSSAMLVLDAPANQVSQEQENVLHSCLLKMVESIDCSRMINAAGLQEGYNLLLALIKMGGL